MGSRRRAREHALQSLYQCDAWDDFSKARVDLYFEIYRPETLQEGFEPGSEIKNIEHFAHMISYGVLDNLERVDEVIGFASENWSIARMSRVDRNILRIGAYELAFLDDVPLNVSINEAIEIAKRYGADDSPMFVNGVLDRIASEIRRKGSIPSAAEQADEKKVINE